MLRDLLNMYEEPARHKIGKIPVSIYLMEFEMNVIFLSSHHKRLNSR
jgi:hypothetical protein